jgi:glucose-6-phosphate isomerase/transaldolase/glucose-6-phosphate isomerase
MAHESALDGPRNSPFLLGRWLAEQARRGRNKMLLVTDPRLGSFGLWAEQLIAESTGKSGQGILPVVSDAATLRREHDAVTVNLSITGLTGVSTHETELDLELGAEMDLGAEFFRWEFATAVCGALLGINPFDEPNVTESKSRTNAVLAMVEAEQAPPDTAKPLSPDDLHGFINQHLTPDGYIALLAFVDPSPLVHDRLLGLRESLERRYHRPVTVGLGPRFLHSTGQLHKGGPDSGVFIQFVDEPGFDRDVPGKPFGFRTLIRAQAQGDLMALADRSRPTLSVDLGNEPARELELLASEAVAS